MSRLIIAIAALLAIAHSNARQVTTLRVDPAIYFPVSNAKTDKVEVQLSIPEGVGPFPAVVILESCAGKTSELMNYWPNLLAQNGYVAMSIFTLESRGFGGCQIKPPYTNHREFVNDFMNAMANDAYGALDHLKRMSNVKNDSIFVVGFSLGAIAINTRLMRTPSARVTGEFNGAVSFYGMCDRRKMLALDRIPLLSISAALDSTHYEPCAQYEGVWGSHKNFTLISLPDTHHGFDVEANNPARKDSTGSVMKFDSDARELAGKYLFDFLGKLHPNHPSK